MPPDEKRKIQAFVPVSIYNQIESFGFKSQNEAVNFAFVKLLESQTNNQDESKMIQVDSNLNQDESNMINQLQATLKETENKFNEFQVKNQADSNLIIELKTRLEEKEIQLRKDEKNQQDRIEDLKAEIQRLSDQLQKNTEILNSQTVNIHGLIQENNRLNIKLLPESTTPKKSLWESLKFW
jgi:hypothetical protein